MISNKHYKYRMLPLFRLLELAGRQPILKETLTPYEASQIFKYYGATDAELAGPLVLKKARNRLIIAHHPDKVGSTGDAAAKEINSAFDVLKTMDTPPTRPTQQTYRRNDKDLRYVQQKFADMADKDSRKYTVWNFDGHFFRGCFTILGKPELFPEMAEAMRIWDDGHFHRRAIFVQKGLEKDIYLIWSDGQDRSPPIKMMHDSFNTNPGNDKQFCDNLPSVLDTIRDNR